MTPKKFLARWGICGDIAVEMEEMVAEMEAELKRRRDTDLKPATKFLKNTLYQQLVAIGREYQEVHYAYLDLHSSWSNPNSDSQEAYKNHLAEELVDLQTVCQTMLVMLEVDIDQVRRDVIAKNARRGYYDRS